ncbi:MAG: alpha/beta fold hydrolase [Gammaproteobacteria bacterium]|nr:alpha/beta fold hydrolase [Gammaproteobacteria bacterium]
MDPADAADEYRPRRPARPGELDGREGRIALTRWGPDHPAPILLLHGWMDCGAGWQLLVDQLPDDWPLVAVDWPGYGRSARRADRYWFADHLAELDWLAGALSPGQPLRLIGHSMGGTVASVYAGVRPARIAWVANLEGFGMPELPPPQLPGQIAGWLDALRAPPTPRRYADLESLAVALRRANPLLPMAHARYLARVWTRAVEGGFEIRADPRQQLPMPIRYARADLEACWSQLRAPLLLLYGAESGYMQRALGAAALARLRALMPTMSVECIAAAGHLLPHERPVQVAQALRRFVARQA